MTFTRSYNIAHSWNGYPVSWGRVGHPVSWSYTTTECRDQIGISSDHTEIFIYISLTQLNFLWPIMHNYVGFHGRSLDCLGFPGITVSLMFYFTFQPSSCGFLQSWSVTQVCSHWPVRLVCSWPMRGRRLLVVPMSIYDWVLIEMMV